MNVPAGRLHPPALTALLLGLASVPLLAVTGVVAMIVGFRSLRRINSSDGELRGARLAVVGMALGALGTAATVIGLTAIVLIRMQLANQRLEGVNHMRLIGIALAQNTEGNRPFPAATRDPQALPGDRRLSWMADILPYMARDKQGHGRFEGIGEQLARDKAWDDTANARAAATPIRHFQAPASPNYDPLRSAMTNFVGIGGVGSDAVSLKREDPLAGMFGHDRGVRANEITRGLTYTLMVLETAKDNGPWIAGGFPTARGVDAKGDGLIGPGMSFGGINPEHVQALWVDGSVRAMKDGTPGDVLRAHARFRE